MLRDEPTEHLSKVWRQYFMTLNETVQFPVKKFISRLCIVSFYLGENFVFLIINLEVGSMG